jgi:hypothetical protein
VADGAGDQDTLRLFQYGSNMHRERFIERIKDNQEHAPRRSWGERGLRGRVCRRTSGARRSSGGSREIPRSAMPRPAASSTSCERRVQRCGARVV